MGTVVRLPLRGHPRLSKRQLAAEFGVSIATVNRWVASGCPNLRAGYKPNSPLRFDLAEVNAWLNEKRTSECSESPRVSTGETVATTQKPMGAG